MRFNEPSAKGWVESYSQILDLYKPFETEMCDWQSKFRETMRLKDEPCQNAIEAVNASLG